MSGSDNELDIIGIVTPSLVTRNDVQQTTWLAETRVTIESILNLSTEKPLAGFAETKTASLIDRIYVSTLVSVGLVFNFLCFVTFVFTSLRTTSTCMYMAAIAVLDSIVLTHALCFHISRYLGQTTFYMRSDWTCGFHYFVFYFTIHFDVLVLLAMTVDRFIVVKFPLKAQSLCTPKSAIKVIAGVGLFPFALNFHIFFSRRLIPSGNAEDPLMCWYPAGEIENFVEQIYSVIDASIYSFIPFVSLLTLNILITRELKRAHRFSKQFIVVRNLKTSAKINQYSKEERQGDADKGRESGSSNHAMTSTSINVMFLLVSFTFLVLTSPVVIVLLYAKHYWKPDTNAETARFLFILAFVDNIMYSNHAVNFLLYCVSGRRFRHELKRLISRIWSQS